MLWIQSTNGEIIGHCFIDRPANPFRKVNLIWASATSNRHTKVLANQSDQSHRCIGDFETRSKIMLFINELYEFPYGSHRTNCSSYWRDHGHDFFAQQQTRIDPMHRWWAKATIISQLNQRFQSKAKNKSKKFWRAIRVLWMGSSDLNAKNIARTSDQPTRPPPHIAQNLLLVCYQRQQQALMHTNHNKRPPKEANRWAMKHLRLPSASW